jgi:hypothetical protein
MQLEARRGVVSLNDYYTCKYGHDVPEERGVGYCTHLLRARAECMHYCHGTSLDGDVEKTKVVNVSDLVYQKYSLSRLDTIVDTMEAEMAKCTIRCALHNLSASDTTLSQARVNYIDAETGGRLSELEEDRPLFMDNIRAKIDKGACGACGWRLGDLHTLDHHPFLGQWASDNEEEGESSWSTARDDRYYYPYEYPAGLEKEAAEMDARAEQLTKPQANTNMPYPAVACRLREVQRVQAPIKGVIEGLDFTGRPSGPSYRPSRSELEARFPGSKWDGSAFFGVDSKRSGQVVNVSSFVAAGDNVLRRASPSQRKGWLPDLRQMANAMRATRWLLDPNCHRLIDSFE